MMRGLIFLTGILAGGFAMASSITVVINGIDVRRGGEVIVFLFEKDGFPKDHSKAIDKKVVTELSERIEVRFDGLPGEFALKVLHDEDRNGEVTKYWTGIIPREGLGFSNGQRLALTGPPKYEHAFLKADEAPSPIEISVRYP